MTPRSEEARGDNSCKTGPTRPTSQSTICWRSADNLRGVVALRRRADVRVVRRTRLDSVVARAARGRIARSEPRAVIAGAIRVDTGLGHGIVPGR